MPNQLTLFNQITCFDHNIIHMLIVGLQTQTMIDDNSVSNHDQKIRKLHNTRIRRNHFRTTGNRIIDAGMARRIGRTEVWQLWKAQ